MLNCVAEECIDDSLVKILKLRFGRDFEFELFGHDIEAEVWSTFRSIFLVKTLRLRFGQDFEAEFWSRF